MKKLLFVMSFMSLVNIQAQDVIVKKDGSTILSKVLEVNTADIKYKKFSNLNGPTYTIDKSDIIAINYENGEKDDFNTFQSSNEMSSERLSSPKYIERKPSQNNSKLIERYRGEIKFATTSSNKDALWFFPIMAVSDSSLMSNDEIEMRFVPTIKWSYSKQKSILRYYIEIENKTNRTIYIDMANTFWIDYNNKYKSYYDTEQISVSNGNSSGATVGLGGIANVLGVGGVAGSLANSISVGGSSQNSVITTFSNERIKAIPPHATANLTDYRQVMNNDTYVTISDAEYWGFLLLKRGVVKRDGHKLYDENDTPYTNKYIITYSTSQDFSTYSVLNAKIYARCIIGCNFSTYEGYEEKLIKKIQKYVSNFWEDPYLLVGTCQSLPKE